MATYVLVHGAGLRRDSAVPGPESRGGPALGDARLIPHPVRTFREPVQLGARSSQMPRTYINCIGDKPFGQPRTIQAEGIEDYRELRTGHDAMVTAPEDFAALLS